MRSLCLGLFVLSLSCTLQAADWVRFRGPGGTGISADEQSPPTQWSDAKNLKWKVALPGPGSSSPIVVGNRIFVTCWTGYGLDRREQGDQKNLKRNLLCIDRKTGKIIWNRAVAAVLPEDSYRGMFAENGYATHTPVSDGKQVYVFFGKSGVLAFDMDGNQLWHVSVGVGRDRRGWGSSSSPILYKNLVIVPAAIESHSLVALDKKTGKQVWKVEADGFASTWGTPILVDLEDGGQEIVLAVPYEIWGFYPETGKLKWYCDGPQSGSMCSSVVAYNGIIYAIESGPDGGGAVAVRAGGKEDVNKTHVVWKGRDRSRIGTPLVDGEYMYWVSGKIANCVDAKTGKRVYQQRLSRSTTSRNQDRQGGSGGGRRRFGGRRGGQDYSSLVAAGGKLYYTTRSGELYVLNLGSKFQELAQNRFDDGGDFSATPAISNGEIFIRSSKNLYCVAKTK